MPTVKLLTPRVTFFPRGDKDQGNPMSSSLMSSVDLSKRLLCSSTSDRAKPLVMKFHKQWLHAHCPVQKWYKLQTQSSTKFTSIEHWRNKNSPFFHEYLLIQLTDGAICRVERTGEGSRRDAITRIGCAAHDIVQWFYPSSYQSDPISSEPAERLSRVDFPRTFDLIDVLAICWSVQRTKRCSVYTLQRYNCYFLCLTILTVLARRVGEWEAVTNDRSNWSMIVHDTMSYLRQTPCKDPDEYTALKVWETIDTEHHDPRSVVLSSLDNYLSVGGYEDMKVATSATMWRKDMNANAKQCLAHGIEHVVNTLLGSSDSFAAEIKRVLDFNRDNDDELQAQSISHDFVQETMKHFVACALSAMTQKLRSREQIRQMQALEHRPSRGSQAVAWAMAPLYYAYLFARGESQMGSAGTNASYANRAFVRAVMCHPLTATYLLRITIMDDLNDDDKRSIGKANENVESIARHQLLESPICATPIAKLHALMMFLDWENWTVSLQECLSKALSNTLDALITQVESESQFNICVTDSDGTRELPVGRFHDYICDRVHTHAKRVEAAKLAAGKLVEIDIEIAISEVWNTLPRGYGGLYI